MIPACQAVICAHKPCARARRAITRFENFTISSITFDVLNDIVLNLSDQNGEDIQNGQLFQSAQTKFKSGSYKQRRWNIHY